MWVSIAIGGIVLILLGIVFLGAIKTRQAESAMVQLLEKDMGEDMEKVFEEEDKQ